MKQYTVRDMRKILRDSGYESVRYKGSHQIWSKGNYTISLPTVTLNQMLARRLVKEINSH